MEFEGVKIQKCRTKIAAKKGLKFWYEPITAGRQLELGELHAIQMGNASRSLTILGQRIKDQLLFERSYP